MTSLMSVKEAAAYIRVSPHTVYAKVSKREIPYVKVGRSVRFDKGALDAWLEEHTVMPIPERER